MRTELVVHALAAAERTRGSLAGAIMHTTTDLNIRAGSSRNSAGQQRSGRAWARSAPARTAPPAAAGNPDPLREGSPPAGTSRPKPHRRGPTSEVEARQPSRTECGSQVV